MSRLRNVVVLVSPRCVFTVSRIELSLYPLPFIIRVNTSTMQVVLEMGHMIYYLRNCVCIHVFSHEILMVVQSSHKNSGPWRSDVLTKA